MSSAVHAVDRPAPSERPTRRPALAWAVSGVAAAALVVSFVLSVALGTGLKGMANRLEAVGGELTVESAHERGTIVVGRASTGRTAS